MPNYIKFLFSFFERVERIELSSLDWKSNIIKPLYDTRRHLVTTAVVVVD